MNIEEVLGLVQGVGFPIAMCLLLFKREGDQNAAHKDEIDKLSAAVNTMSTAVTGLQNAVDRLLDRIGGDKE